MQDILNKALVADPDGKARDAFAYDFNCYEATSSGERPVEDCFRQLKEHLNHENYLVNIFTPDPGSIRVEDLRAARYMLEENDYFYSLEIHNLEDPLLSEGTVRVKVLTFFIEGYSHIAQLWSTVCEECTAEEFAEESDSFFKEVCNTLPAGEAEASIRHGKEYALLHVGYSPKRPWKETRRVMAFLLEHHSPLTTAALWDTVIEGLANPHLTVREKDFHLRKIRFLLEHGANPNIVREGMTLLDYAKGEPEDRHFVKLTALLLKYGARTREQQREAERRETTLREELIHWKYPV